MSSQEACTISKLEGTLLQAQTRITELMLENKRLASQIRMLVPNTSDESHQPESEQNILVQATPKDKDGDWRLIIGIIYDMKKLLLEKRNVDDLDINKDIYNKLTCKVLQIESLITYINEEAQAEIDSSPGTDRIETPTSTTSLRQESEEEIDRRSFLENSFPLEERERTLIHDYEDKINAQDMTLRARQAIINEQNRTIKELEHKVQQSERAVLDAFISNQTGEK